VARPKGAKTQKPDARKTGPRAWTLTEREGLKVQAAKLDLQGYTQRDIAEKLDLSQSTACLLLKEIRADYESAYVTCRKALVMQATAAYLDVIRQAQEELERLRARGKRKTVTEEGTTDKGGFRKTVRSREDAEIAGLLSVVTENWTRIARLHGLEELPKQVFNLTVNNNQSNIFDQLLQALLAEPGPSAPAIGRAEDGRAGPARPLVPHSSGSIPGHPVNVNDGM
jgi:hypothetical protein